MFKLNLSDLLKGLVVAVAAPMVSALGAALSIPGFDFMVYDWKHLAALGVVAGLGYILKNFFTDTQGKFMGKI